MGDNVQNKGWQNHPRSIGHNKKVQLQLALIMEKNKVWKPVRNKWKTKLLVNHHNNYGDGTKDRNQILLLLYRKTYCTIIIFQIHHLNTKCLLFRKIPMWCCVRTTRIWRGMTAMKASAWTCSRSWQTFSSSNIASVWLGTGTTGSLERTEHGPAWLESSYRGWVAAWFTAKLTQVMFLLFNFLKALCTFSCCWMDSVR